MRSKVIQGRSYLKLIPPDEQYHKVLEILAFRSFTSHSISMLQSDGAGAGKIVPLLNLDPNLHRDV